MSKRTIVVIGGGVVGLSTAYQLARRQAGRIVLLEKGVLGEGSSRRAAGITTGLLWSEPGVLARKISIQLFRELGQSLDGYTFHNEHGCLNLLSPELWPDREALLPLYDRLGAPYRVFSAAEIHRQWPALHPQDDFVGVHDPVGGYSEPPDYIRGLAKKVGELGVEIREQQTVTGWLADGQRIAGVRTHSGPVQADAVVSTVHAWTLPVLEPLDVRLPVKYFVHQRYVSAPVRSNLAFPPVNADPFGGYIRPAAGNRILLGVETAKREEWRVTSTDFTMAELSTPAGLRDQTVQAFMPFFPDLKDVPWETAEVGLISFSVDGEPVLGPVAGAPGLFVGLAFHSGGFSYNPVAGLLLAEWVMDGKTSIDVSAFSPNRFERAATDDYLAQRLLQENAVRRRH